MKSPVANKALGQHYLKDQSVINKIISDSPSDFDYIMEVGPGPATLTRYLSEEYGDKRGKKLFVIEKDKRFFENLEATCKIETLYFEDALRFDWDAFCKQYPGKVWLVSNLPYNISTLLYLSFIRVPSIVKMTLMYQKEVGEKTVFRSGVKNQMNSLYATGNLLFNTKTLCKVSPGAFLPPPKVDSIVISYTKKECPLINYDEIDHFERFARLIFSFKRKQLGSVLKASAAFKIALQERRFDLKKRAETLSFDEVFELFKIYRDLDTTRPTQ